MTPIRDQKLWSPNTESLIKYLISDSTLGVKFEADLEVQGTTDETLRVKINNPQFIVNNNTISLMDAAPILEKSGLAVGNGNHNMQAFIRHIKTPMMVQFKKGRAKAIITMDGEPSSVTNIKKNLALQLEKNKPNSHLQLKRKQQIVHILQTPLAPKTIKVRKITITIKNLNCVLYNMRYLGLKTLFTLSLIFSSQKPRKDFMMTLVFHSYKINAVITPKCGTRHFVLTTGANFVLPIQDRLMTTQFQNLAP